jgi:hypothetical protein
VDSGRRFFSPGPARPKQSTGRHHGRRLEGVQADYLGHKKRQDLILHDLDQEGIQLYSLATAKMSHGGPAAIERVGQTSMVAGAPSSDALAPRCTPAVAV